MGKPPAPKAGNFQLGWHGLCNAKLLSLAAFLFLFAAPAFAANCTERDYRGLVLKAEYPPLYGEAICQLKLLFKNRTNHDSFRQFVDLSQAETGIGSKDLNFSAPLVGVINDLLNNAIQDGSVQKVASAAQKYFARYNLDAGEKALLDMLVLTEIQHGGRRL